MLLSCYACFEAVQLKYCIIVMIYQDEGVDTSLLAAEAGCACSESWNGGYYLFAVYDILYFLLIDFPFLNRTSQL